MSFEAEILHLEWIRSLVIEQYHNLRAGTINITNEMINLFNRNQSIIFSSDVNIFRLPNIYSLAIYSIDMCFNAEFISFDGIFGYLSSKLNYFRIPDKNVENWRIEDFGGIAYYIMILFLKKNTQQNYLGSELSNEDPESFEFAYSKWINNTISDELPSYTGDFVFDIGTGQCVAVLLNRVRPDTIHLNRISFGKEISKADIYSNWEEIEVTLCLLGLKRPRKSELFDYMCLLCFVSSLYSKISDRIQSKTFIAKNNSSSIASVSIRLQQVDYLIDQISQLIKPATIPISKQNPVLINNSIPLQADLIHNTSKTDDEIFEEHLEILRNGAMKQNLKLKENMIKNDNEIVSPKLKEGYKHMADKGDIKKPVDGKSIIIAPSSKKSNVTLPFSQEKLIFKKIGEQVTQSNNKQEIEMRGINNGYSEHSDYSDPIDIKDEIVLTRIEIPKAMDIKPSSIQNRTRNNNDSYLTIHDKIQQLKQNASKQNSLIKRKGDESHHLENIIESEDKKNNPDFSHVGDESLEVNNNDSSFDIVDEEETWFDSNSDFYLSEEETLNESDQQIDNQEDNSIKMFNIKNNTESDNVPTNNNEMKENKNGHPVSQDTVFVKEDNSKKNYHPPIRPPFHRIVFSKNEEPKPVFTSNIDEPKRTSIESDELFDFIKKSIIELEPIGKENEAKINDYSEYEEDIVYYEESFEDNGSQPISNSIVVVEKTEPKNQIIENVENKEHNLEIPIPEEDSLEIDPLNISKGIDNVEKIDKIPDESNKIIEMNDQHEPQALALADVCLDPIKPPENGTSHEENDDDEEESLIFDRNDSYLLSSLSQIEESISENEKSEQLIEVFEEGQLNSNDLNSEYSINQNDEKTKSLSAPKSEHRVSFNFNNLNEDPESIALSTDGYYSSTAENSVSLPASNQIQKYNTDHLELSLSLTKEDNSYKDMYMNLLNNDKERNFIELTKNEEAALFQVIPHCKGKGKPELFEEVANALKVSRIDPSVSKIVSNLLTFQSNGIPSFPNMQMNTTQRIHKKVEDSSESDYF